MLLTRTETQSGNLVFEECDTVLCTTICLICSFGTAIHCAHVIVFSTPTVSQFIAFGAAVLAYPLFSIRTTALAFGLAFYHCMEYQKQKLVDCIFFFVCVLYCVRIENEIGDK